MSTAMAIGQTGLAACQKQLDVISNNLANSNTTGFKASSTLFSSMMNQGLSSSGALAVGQGVGVTSLPTQFSQGAFENTGNVTDMAIDGEGFFILKQPAGAALYTRSGAFHINRDSNLVDYRGYKVQGYDLTSGIASNVIEDIILPRQKNATSTTNISFGANLSEDTPAGGLFEVATRVYDSLGTAHTLTMIFEKDAAAGTWNVTATCDGPTGAPVTLSDAQVTFDGDGNLLTPAADATITIDVTDPSFKGATIGTAGVLDWNLISDTTRPLTGFGSESSIRSIYADGYGAGELRSLNVDKSGIVSGNFTNGQTIELFQIALANFQDQGALTKSGSYFMESTESGIPTVIIGMITAQRAYQANAKVITTADNILAELMNIKR